MSFLIRSKRSGSRLLSILIITVCCLQSSFCILQSLVKRFLLIFRRSVVNRIAWSLRISFAWLQVLVGVNLRSKSIGLNACTLNCVVKILHCLKKILVQLINLIRILRIALSFVKHGTSCSRGTIKCLLLISVIRILVCIALSKLIRNNLQLFKTSHSVIGVDCICERIVNIVNTSVFAFIVNVILCSCAVDNVFIRLLLRIVQMTKLINSSKSIRNLLCFQRAISNTRWVAKLFCIVDIINSLLLVSIRKIACINARDLLFLFVSKSILVFVLLLLFVVLLRVSHLSVDFFKRIFNLHAINSSLDIRRLGCFVYSVFSTIDCSLGSFNLLLNSFFLSLIQAIFSVGQLLQKRIKLGKTRILSIFFVNCVLALGCVKSILNLFCGGSRIRLCKSSFQIGER